jgi:hypothetical protein
VFVLPVFLASLQATKETRVMTAESKSRLGYRPKKEIPFSSFPHLGKIFPVARHSLVLLG